jgi:hypothetical protein
MYETGDIVRFRPWSNKPWEEGEWIILTVNVERFNHEEYYSYTIQNLETKQCQYEVNWQQIEAI